MDQDLAWPLAGLGASAIAGTAAALSAGQPLTAAVIAVTSALAALAVWAAWRRVRRRVDQAGQQLQTMTGHSSAGASRTTEQALGRLDENIHRLRDQIEQHLSDLAKKSANLQAIIDGLNEPVLATGAGATANSIRAGVTVTPALLKIPESQLMIDVTMKRNPTGRMTTPQDVANAILALSGDGTEFINGDIISVDGGEFITGS